MGRTICSTVARFNQGIAAWFRADRRRGRALSIVCKYGLGLGLLAVVIWLNWAPESPYGLKAALERPVRGGALLLAAACCTCWLPLIFYRWYVLVRAQDLPFTLLNAWRLGLVGFYFNTFLPGSIGGDIIKAAFLARGQSRRTVAVATVIIDRAIGLWALFWLVALLGTLFWVLGNEPLHASAKLQIIWISALATVGVTMVLWLLLGLVPDRKAERFARKLHAIPKVGVSAAEFWRAIHMYRRKGAAVAAAIGLSLMAQSGMVLTFYLAAQVFSEQVPTLAEHFLIVPIGLVVQALFPAPGGVGGGEFGFGKLYQLVGRPEASGVLGSLAQRVIFWGLGLVGYLVYLRMRPALAPAVAQAEEESPELPEPGTEGAGVQA